MSIEYRKPKTLSQLEEENAKLREQIHWLKQGDILHVLTDQEYIDQCERERLMQVSIDALDDENAKLRELVSEHAHANERLLTELKRYKGIVRARHQDPVPHLVNENAKLRELVKALQECTAKTIPAKRCTECDLFDGEDGCLDLVRMRELGIEED